MKPIRIQRGAIAVELGIILMPLFILTLGVTEIGRAIYQYNTVIKSTRDAVRFLSGQGAGDPADITVARCLAVYGNKTCTGPTLLPNLATAMVSVCDSFSCAANHLNQPTGSGVVNLVTVTTTGYPFKSLAPFFVPDIAFGPISTTMRQVL